MIIALLTSIFWKKGNIFWYDNETASLLGIGRLKLFTSEASVYSLLLVPLFFYYFQYFYFKNFNAIRFKSLIIIGISLVLSTSYGAIGGIISSLSLFFLLNLIFFKRTEYNLKFLILFASLIAIAIVLILGPLSDSLIVTRVFNILGGEDSSVNGRSIEAISLAERVIKLKSEIFGVGPGQIKIVGVQIFSDFYDYSSNNDTTVRIPSAVGDTFAVFGYLGLITRFLLEIYLFIKTKVFSSSYRLCLFIFMFIFQFAGGDTADVVSYFIWTLSFTPVFPDSYFKSSRNHIRINDAEKGNFNNNCYI
ncbi:hypothetical protein [Pedobacter agri]|uniref:hypothetical protein n=1 Tax=Pedobacter agri TaxID=454586 RepID=UPI00292D689A|nr:hypothetical protein [Pedobacter agri]